MVEIELKENKEFNMIETKGSQAMNQLNMDFLKCSLLNPVDHGRQIICFENEVSILA